MLRAVTAVLVALLATVAPAGAQSPCDALPVPGPQTSCTPTPPPGLACVAAGTAPACPGTATIEILIQNHTADASVTIQVDGELVDPAATCPSGGVVAYGAGEPLACPPQDPAEDPSLPPCTFRCSHPTCAVTISGLRPGAWINRIRAQPAGSDVQRQAQRAVFAAATSGVAPNRLAWTVYAQTFMVRAKAAANQQADEFLGRLRGAAEYLAAGGRSALVTFDWSRPADGYVAFPGACNPAVIEPYETKTCPEGVDDCSPDADTAVCWWGSGIVLDALDRNGEPGGIILSGTRVPAPLVRIAGHDNVLRGLRLHGHRAGVTQADTVVFMGPLTATGRPAASGNRLEQVTVDGPGQGDAVSAQCGSHDNLVARSIIRCAEDKGVKTVEGARLAVEDSCVADNANGGVQATRAGRAEVRRNVVQHNLPGAAGNGIWARGVPGLAPSTVATDANLVRYSGSRGLSATDDARADFRNDFVAHNQFHGARVETTAPCSPRGPAASFAGVAFVCNGAIASNGEAQLSGRCEVSGAPCTMADGCCPDGVPCDEECRNSAPDGVGLSIGFASGEFGCCGTCDPPPDTCDACSACTGPCEPPAVDLAGGGNAFVRQPIDHPPNPPRPGAALQVAVPGLAVDARGNQWEGCTAPGCTPPAGAVVTAPGAAVDTTPTALPPSPPTLTAVWPHRPARGDLVRVWGTGFDVLGLDAQNYAGCWTDPPPADHCDPSDCRIATLNGTSVGNHVEVRLAGVSRPVDVHAITPTMIAFRMPFDCFAANGRAVVERGGQSATIALCDLPGECENQPDGVACTEDDSPCTADVCQAGTCRHLAEPRAGIPCRPAAGGCDVAEHCDGVTAACPADGMLARGLRCRTGSGDACDPDELCTGTSPACPPDVVLPVEAVCRLASDVCDLEESCPGVPGDLCPPDGLASDAVRCRSGSGDACDPDEYCTGTTARCPEDRVSPAITVCRTATDLCDAVESCPGVVGARCPPDARAAVGTPCRATPDACDPVESCDGASPACPPDVGPQGVGAVRCHLRPLTREPVGCAGPQRRRDRMLRRIEALLADADERLESQPCKADRALARAERLLPRLKRLHDRRACLAVAAGGPGPALAAAATDLGLLRTATGGCPRRR